MYKISAIIFSAFVFSSCVDTGKINDTQLTEVVKYSPKDTTISYDIDGISSEGSEAIVKYIKGKIKESTVNIYGETGQAKIVFVFVSNQINVTETKFSYRMGIENVKSDKDMVIEREIKYVLDSNGSQIDKSHGDYLDIFNEFKRTVPFELNGADR